MWDGRAKGAAQSRPAARLGGGGGGSGGGGGGAGAGPAWSVALTGEARLAFELPPSPGGVGGDENEAPREVEEEAAGTSSPPPSTFPLLALAGHATGLVRLWCLRTGKPRWSGRLPGSPGVCGVAFSPDGAAGGGQPTALFTAATGGLVAGLEAGTQHPEAGLAGAGARLGGGANSPPPTVWAACPLPASRNLVACPCGDGAVRLLRYARAPGAARVSGAGGSPAGVAGRLVGVATARLSPQALTCFNWSPGYAGLWAAGGLDEVVRVGVVPRVGIV